MTENKCSLRTLTTARYHEEICLEDARYDSY